MIVNKANCLYHLCVSNSNYKGKSRCLDFKKLEKACEKYNSKQLKFSHNFPNPPSYSRKQSKQCIV
nr:type III toxin-antitoxin system ToxN/AbiQ family toxin [Lachnospiraceae bacterium]